MKFPRPLIYIPKIFSKRSLTARETNTPKPTPFSQKKKKKKKNRQIIFNSPILHLDKKKKKKNKSIKSKYLNSKK